MSSTTTDYTDATLLNEPLLELRKPVSTPERDNYIGRIAVDKSGGADGTDRDGHMFVKQVVRDRHLYRKYEGYCFTDSVLDRFKDAGVQRIFVHEKDTGLVIEYDPDDFVIDIDVGIYSDESQGETQSCGPINDALARWDGLGDELFIGDFWENVE